MAILKIARMGHPVLARRAQEVPDPTAPEIKALVQDMLETMVDAEGMGLAAPQVHVPLRVVIFVSPKDAAEAASEDVDWTGLTALVNPEIEPLGDERGESWEGCLSVPGLRGLVPRPARVRYRGTTPAGERIEREVEGLHATVVQHECDHLDGVLYPQRMADLKKLVFESEMRFMRGPAAEEAE